jgi:hypothetical protein
MTPSAPEFLAGFFRAPNTSWPGCDPTHPAAGYLEPFAHALDLRGECPLILPRKEPTWAAPITYVICWDVSHSTRVRPLLEAAAAHSWVPFDGRIARLDLNDRTEAGIADLVGPHSTFRLTPTSATHAGLWRSLSRLVTTLDSRPPRTFTLPRPAGRMLREFEAALASGQADTSAALLREIDLAGGVSLENLAFLSVRRFSRLGKDAELLAMPTLDAIATAEPPKVIQDAILAAWSRRFLSRESLEDQDDVPQLVELLKAHRPPLAVLVRDDVDQTWSDDALSAVALVAVARASIRLAGSVLDQAHSLPPALQAQLVKIARERDSEREAPAADAALESETMDEAQRSEAQSWQPGSWLEWLHDALSRPEAVRPPNPDQAESWGPIGLLDDALAAAIDLAPDSADDAVLAMAGVFIDADQYLHPAWRCASALIRRYLLAERLTPSDLAVICVLLGIALRGGPPAADYRGLLEDVQSYAPMWVSPGQPLPALDLADVIASSARPDPATAAALASTLLGPLHAQRRRISGPICELAALITNDLDLAWDWAAPGAGAGEDPEPSPPVESRDPLGLLLYSLDEAVLRRVATAIRTLYPEARVTTSSDKVGSPRLRDLASGADLVVLATQCAAHSATGFIVDHLRPDATLIYPNGAGSASMLRAIEQALETR